MHNAAAHFPHLSLGDINIDRELARQLPRGLAYYYTALPIGRDEGRIGVAMARPDDLAAISVLESVLDSRVIPVRAAGKEIRAKLDWVWRDVLPVSHPQILCWGWDSTEVETYLPVRLLTRLWTAQVTFVNAGQVNVHTALTIARQGNYNLAAIDVSGGGAAAHLARQSSTPLLLIGSHRQTQLRRILLVLRGHSPDDRALDWVIPLARETQAAVTLLAVASPTLPRYTFESRVSQGIAALLYRETGPGHHALSCAQRLNEAGIEGYLKLQQGPPAHQIAQEMTQGRYDLVSIAAEAHGDFVKDVLSEAETQAALTEYPVLVTKPALL
jgi:hypothetical protein